MKNQDPPKPLPSFFVGKAITLNRIADYQAKNGEAADAEKKDEKDAA